MAGGGRLGWARTPGHDGYWSFTRPFTFSLVPEPGRATLDLGCGEGRLARDLGAAGHRVVGIDASPTLVGMPLRRMRRANTTLADPLGGAPSGPTVRGDGLRVNFRSWHRPLQAYTDAFAGFMLEDLVEAPDAESPRWTRLPIFLGLRLLKPATKQT